jgi:Class II flagellar assembly regulator.
MKLFALTMKIEALKTYTVSRSKKATKAGKGAAFEVNSNAESSAEGITSSRNQAEVASLSSLMQLQEIRKGSATKAEAMAGGEAVLKSLENLQSDILRGTISKTSLERIAMLTEQLPLKTDDPHLQSVLAEIKQRALVELAKIEMSEKP